MIQNTKYKIINLTPYNNQNNPNNYNNLAVPPPIMQSTQPNAVQERIKRLMKEKKMAKDSQSQIRKRVASQNYEMGNNNETSSLTMKENQEDEMTIRTEWRKRNTGSEKHRETDNSEGTTSETSGQSSRVEVEKILNNIFAHSPKVMQYLEQYNLRKEDASNELLSNELFVLSLGTKLTKLSNADNSDNQSAMNVIVENEIILKLTKLNRKKKHSLTCYDIENRIKTLINRRLDLLHKY